jgi:hypothetical protein
VPLLRLVPDWEQFESAESGLHDRLTETVGRFREFQAEVAGTEPVAEQAGHVIAVLKAFADSMDMGYPCVE